MPSPRVIRFAELEPSRWANGAGETVELLRHPDRGDFDVRLSIATVGSAAPFSALPGVSRALMALAPEGLTLEIDGELRKLASHDVARFEGEQSVRARDVSAPGRDLNLMVRRAFGGPELHAVEVIDHHVVDDPRAVAVVALAGQLRHDGRSLRFGDCVIAAGEPLALTGRGTVAVALVVPARRR